MKLSRISSPVWLLSLIIVFTDGCSISAFKKGKLIPAKQEPVQISFERHKKLILIPATIRGIDGLFLFDNGFSMSAVNKAFAEKAGITFQNTRSVTDANSRKVSTPTTLVDTVRIGSQTFVNTGFYQIETDTFFPCKQIDGIIGASIINKINWDFDFDEQLAQLSSTPFEKEGILLDVSFSNNNSNFTELEIAGVTYTTKIDFGSTAKIELDYDRAYSSFKGMQVQKWQGISSISAHGLGNIETSYETAEPIIPIHNRKKLPVPAPVGLTEDLKYEAYVGINYLDNYTLTMNNTDKVYILGTPYPEEPEPQESYGFTAYPVDGVWKIIRKNPADSLLNAIETMAEIELLDGEPIQKFPDICSYRKYLETKQETSELLQLKLKETGETFILPYSTIELTTLQ